MRLPRGIRRLFYRSWIESMDCRPVEARNTALINIGGDEVRVFGGSSIWHDAETGERMPTWVEGMLLDRWRLERHRAEERAEGRSTRWP